MMPQAVPAELDQLVAPLSFYVFFNHLDKDKDSSSILTIEHATI